jgi:hypothetical protein
MALQPPFYDPPIADYPSGQQHSQAWTEYHQSLADETAANTAAIIAKAGRTDGSDAMAGQIGEYMLGATSSAVTLTNGVVANLASITLTPGDWDVSGSVFFLTPTGGTPFLFGVGIAGIDTQITATFQAGPSSQILQTALTRYNITAPTVLWVVAKSDWTGSSTQATANIRARRVR